MSPSVLVARKKAPQKMKRKKTDDMRKKVWHNTLRHFLVVEIIYISPSHCRALVLGALVCHSLRLLKMSPQSIQR